MEAHLRLLRCCLRGELSSRSSGESELAALSEAGVNLLWDQPRTGEGLAHEVDQAPDPEAAHPHLSPSGGTQAPDPQPSAAIAIVSMACRLPGGIDSPDELWQALLEGCPLKCARGRRGPARDRRGRPLRWLLRVPGLAGRGPGRRGSPTRFREGSRRRRARVRDGGRRSRGGRRCRRAGAHRRGRVQAASEDRVADPGLVSHLGGDLAGRGLAGFELFVSSLARNDPVALV